MSKRAKAPACNFDGWTGCYLCQPVTPINYDTLNGGRTLQEERIHKRRINNQLEVAEINNDDDSTFADPDQAEEDEEEEEQETVGTKTDAPSEDQRAQEPAVVMIPPPSILPLTSLQKLEAVYGTVLHHDNRTQLDRDFVDDKLWQTFWREIVALPAQRYDVPVGRVDRIFVDALAEELEGVDGRRWNVERFIVFQVVILQRTTEV